MNYDCRITEVILSMIIIVFALTQWTVGQLSSQWVIVIAAALLFIHAIICENCRISAKPFLRKAAAKKKSRKKR